MTAVTDYKWGEPPQTPTVAFFHRRMRELFEERLAASGKRWEEAVFDPELALTREDLEGIEAELLATGHRFAWSARISLDEAPGKHVSAEAEAESVVDLEAELSEQGRALVGSGDNVFKTKEAVTGIARVVSTIETVMEMLTQGVPPETIAIIDDSGGTLTAPILEGFTAVVCKGGTIRSHLGILTREFGIPCLMAAELKGINDGDRIQVEYTAPAAAVYADDPRATVRARIWKLR